AGAIDHDAVAQTVGGDHDRPFDLELLFERRCHAASLASASSSAARHGVERATTSPITRMAGPSPAPAASAARSERRPTAARESGLLPRASTAAGVVAARPAAMRPSRTAPADARPI